MKGQQQQQLRWSHTSSQQQGKAALEVIIIRAEALKEVALGLDDAAELVNVDHAGAIMVSLGERDLVRRRRCSLRDPRPRGSRLEVEEGDPVDILSSSNSLKIFSVSSRESFSPILQVFISGNSESSTVPLPSSSGVKQASRGTRHGVSRRGHGGRNKTTR